MSFYGTKNLSGPVKLEKRRFRPNNTLRFGNVCFVAAYDPDTLLSVNFSTDLAALDPHATYVTKESSALVVNIGDDKDCVTIAIGPQTDSLYDFKVIDLVEDTVLDPGLNCVVLEGIVTDETGNVFDSEIGIPHFVTLSEPVNLTVNQQAKLLLFKIQ